MVRERRREHAALITDAIALARSLDRPEVFWFAAYNVLFHLSAPQREQERLALVEELLASPRTGIPATLLATVVWFAAWTLLTDGQRARMEELLHEFRVLAERIGQPNLALNMIAADGILATFDGRLEEAAAIGDQIAARAAEAGLPAYGFTMSLVASLQARLYLGRPVEEALQATYLGPRTLGHAHLGQSEVAVALLDEQVVQRPAIGTDRDETQSWVDAMYLEAAVLTGHRAAADLLRRRLARGQAPLTSGPVFHTCPARHIAAAAVLLGGRAEARAWYERALRDAERVRFRPEAALARLGLAELGRDGSEREREQALAQLAVCIPELRDMQMQPALERALHLRNALVEPSSAAPPGAGASADAYGNALVRSAPRYPDQLSAREVEVLRLLATGRSNREIAAELVVSVRTAEHHIASIYAKIGAHRRADAVAYARRQGLSPPDAPAPSTTYVHPSPPSPR